MEIRNEDGKLIDIYNIERTEQDLANKYILGDDVVLELGARYGSVSCVINSKLANKSNQVVVEPDDRVWDALEKNKIRNNCQFNIVKGFISKKKLDLINLDAFLNGYGSTFVENTGTKIPSYTLDEIRNKYNVPKFNVLVADCEGFLERFFDENPDLYDDLRLIIFEADYPDKCDYNKIKNTLANKNFLNLVDGHQNVWLRVSHVLPSLTVWYGYELYWANVTEFAMKLVKDGSITIPIGDWARAMIFGDPVFGILKKIRIVQSGKESVYEHNQEIHVSI
jgi:FkbM family methyltransferase